MRIVETDNFGRDYPNESFILWPMRKELAERIADIINEEGGPNAQRFYIFEST